MRNSTRILIGFAYILLCIFLSMSVFRAVCSAQEVPNSDIAEIQYPDGYVPYFNDETCKLLAKMLYGEGGRTVEQRAGACYTVFWQYNSGAGPIKHILEQWYYGYSSRNPVTQENYEIAKDVYIRYDMFQCGYSIEQCGIVLPDDYRYFNSNGKGDNVFRNHFNHSKANYWDWSLPSPYSEVS